MPNTPNSPKPPGSGLDTGTGGFSIGPNAVRQTYDIGAEVGDEYTKTSWSPGQVNVDKEVKDLSRGTKSTLAAYLSDTTLGKSPSSPVSVRNAYPVNHVDGLDPDELSLVDEKGYPAQPDKDLDGHLYKFVPGKNLESRSKADTNLKIKRGRQDGNLPDGNELLKNVSPVAPPASALGGKFSPAVGTFSLPQDNPVKQYYGNPALSNSVIYNRFNPENNEYQTRSSALSSDQFAKKYEYGTSVANRDMSFGRLAQVGSVLSTRAGVELGSMDAGYNPSQEVGSAAAPGIAQLGVAKINRERLTAESVLEVLTEASVPDGTLFDAAGDSWGTLNNVNDQFDNVAIRGMQLLAVAMLVALAVVVAAMTALFSLGSSGTIYKKDDRGKYFYGMSKVPFQDPKSSKFGRFVFSFWKLFELEPTNNPINKCIPTGAMAFFGMNVFGMTEVTSAGMAALAALKGLESVSASPGYYSVIGRTVARSFILISRQFEMLGPAFSSGAFSGLSQVLSVIKTISNSRFMRILNLFAHIGDNIIEASKRDEGTGITFGPGSTMKFTSDLDIMPDDSALKSRMNPAFGVNPLTNAWASYRAPDLFIVPNGLQKVLTSPLSRDLGAPTVYTSLLEGSGELKRDSYYYGDNRIKTEERESLEQLLESEYVPFYMHDVRTNEIVSFHAFLASLTDDYTANYDTQEAMGRVEAIKIYKSTQRKIGFSFYVVSTNERDFDAMWLKINKLTTMVYPQFTEGKTIADANNKIYMPFSQTIQAAPLVRVRIGDLIRSNYSKFNLARVFGYTYEGTKFNGKEFGKDTPEEVWTQEKYDEEIEVLKKTPGNYFLSDRKVKGVGSPHLVELVPGLVLEVVKYFDYDNTVNCKVVVATGEDRSKNLSDRRFTEIKNQYGEKGSIAEIIDQEYEFDLSDLRPAPSTASKASNKAGGEYSNAVREFMIDNDNTKGNAIARSFRSVGGKGLAGFVDSMSFDWYDGVTWTTNEGPGRKAPKMCKVTISFSPIHDITPGLDHTGANRAPLYPVRGLNDPTRR